MSIYARGRALMDRMADKYNQGPFTLTRTSPSMPDPDRPWEPVEPGVQEESLNGFVRGVDTRLVGTEAGGSVILSSDRVATCTVPAMGYQAGDVLSVDGKPVHILSVENIPAAGTTTAAKFIIRG